MKAIELRAIEGYLPCQVFGLLRLTTFLAALLIAAPLPAWERVTMRSGEVFEGDSSFAELVLADSRGGEIVVPRPALDRLEVQDGRVVVFVKDGTRVEGALKGLLEIEDGMVRRRFAGEELSKVEFDLYIDPSTRKSFRSCPIRMELDPRLMFAQPGDRLVTATPARVSCRELSILSIGGTLKQAGSRRKGFDPSKQAMLDAEFMIHVPAGEDQLVDLSIRVVQGHRLLALGTKRLVIDEAKNIPMDVSVVIPAGQIDLSRPPVRLHIQLVNQDEKEKVQQGGFFWWFTIPIG